MKKSWITEKKSFWAVLFFVNAAFISPSHSQYSNWMEQIYPHIQNVPINQMLFPGTHDSGAYELFLHLGYAYDIEDQVLNIDGTLHDINDELGILFDDDWLLIVPDIVRSWGTAHNRDFYQQLNDGIRYLDFRIDKSPVDGQLRTFHGLFGNTVDLLLTQIANYMQTVNKEIVIVDASHMYTLTDSDHASLMDKFVSKLGAYMIPGTVDLSAATYGELVQNGPRVLVIYDDSYLSSNPNSNFWNANIIEGEYANSSDLSDMWSHNETKVLDEMPTHSAEFFKLSWTLTPQSDDIQNGLLHFLLDSAGSFIGDVLSFFGVDLDDIRSAPKNLRELVDRANPALNGFDVKNPFTGDILFHITGFTEMYYDAMLQKCLDKRVNIVVVDFYQTSGVVPLMVRMNRDINNAPQPMIKVETPDPILEGTVVKFNGSASIDSDPGDSLSFEWNFGDAAPADYSVFPTHVFADDGDYSVSLNITDDCGAFDAATVTLTVLNAPPVIESMADRSSLEGETVALSVNFSDMGASDSHTAHIDWGDGSGAPAVVTETPFGPPGSESGMSGTVTASHVYADDGVYPVIVYVKDDEEAESQMTFNVSVHNVAPQITANGDSINENQTAYVSGAIADPGVLDSFKLTIDWGEGPPEIIDLPAGSASFNVPHQYLDDNPTDTEIDDYSIFVTVEDDDGGVASVYTLVTVENVSPVITLSDVTINENDTATLSGSIVDPGEQDAFTIVVNWGDGVESVYEYPAGAQTFSEEHAYLDDNPTDTPSDDYYITASITDDDQGFGFDEANITVNNLIPAPSIDQMTDETGAVIGIQAPGVLVGLPVYIFGSFTDAGTQDTHTADIDWANGVQQNLGAASPAAPILADAIYSSPGIYTLTLFVMDDDTGVGFTTAELQVFSFEGSIVWSAEALQPYEENSFVAKAIGKLIGQNGGNAENGAVDLLDKDNTVAWLTKIQQAVQLLEDAEDSDPSLDLASVKSFLSLISKSAALDYITLAQSSAVSRNDQRKVQQAESLHEEGNASLENYLYVMAVEKYLEACKKIQGIS